MHCPLKETHWTAGYHLIRAAPRELLFYPCPCSCWVAFELVESKDVFLIRITVHLFLLPSEKPFIFPFSFCPHFIHYVSQIHAALSASCCCCRWLFTARRQITFPWVLLHQTSTSSTHTLPWTCIYRQNTHTHIFHFFVAPFLCIWHCFHLCFCFFILCFVDSWMAPAGFMAWPVWMI